MVGNEWFLDAVGGAAAGMSTDGTGTGVTVNLLVGLDAIGHHLEKALGGNPKPLDPNDPLTRCETDSGGVIDAYDMLAAAAMGHVRRVVLDSAGVVVDVGRKQRLFTGPLREAVLLSSRRCTWGGCNLPGSVCQADHVLPWSNAGPTSTATGTTAAPTAPKSAGAPKPEPSPAADAVAADFEHPDSLVGRREGLLCEATCRGSVQMATAPTRQLTG